MKLYRFEARVADSPEPTVDWFRAATESEARTLWEREARECGLPMSKTTVEVREATEKEIRLLEGGPFGKATCAS